MVLTANAAEINFSASVDKTSVALDDTLNYTINISGSDANRAPSPALPSFSNLRAIASGSSSNISIINGQTSVQKAYTYTLQPTSRGTGQIGQAKIVVDGTEYTTDPISVSITSATGQNKQRPQVKVVPKQSNIWAEFDNFFRRPFPSITHPDIIEDPIKIATTVSNSRPYVNELIVLTFTFYRRVNLLSSPNYSPPDTKGFWAIDLPATNNQRQVEIDGNTYLAQDFKTALFPTTSGPQTIGPAALVAAIDPFGPAETFKTKPITISALPLPEDGKPDNFGGSVGSYSMDVWLKDKTVEQGKPIQIIAKISGTGNIQTISEPVIDLPKEFKKLSVTATEDLVKNPTSISGSKTFEIILIPLKDGEITLPAFEFSYFNPATHQYKTIKSKPLHLFISPSSIPLPKEFTEQSEDDSQNNTVNIVIPWRKIARLIIKTITSTYFLVPLFLIIVSALSFFSFNKYKANIAADPAKARYNRALKLAKKKLKKSYNLIKQNKLKEFIAEIFYASTHYLGDKYNFSAAGITTDQLKDILSGKGISEEIQKQVENFISECDFIRFTPSSLTPAKATDLAKIAENLIILIEKQ
ncbi:MAG: BatD family protein [Candidatus Margulisbacteria bacterium]|nr:BatD family protein [Candidatus Margulisiibacteriota bacterium]